MRVRAIQESEFEAVADLRVDAFLAAGMVKDRETTYAHYLRTVHDLVLSVISHNAAAHRLYSRLGFTREPSRDFSPTTDVLLEVNARPVR